MVLINFSYWRRKLMTVKKGVLLPQCYPPSATCPLFVSMCFVPPGTPSRHHPPRKQFSSSSRWGMAAPTATCARASTLSWTTSTPQKITELTRESLGCDADDVLMVNFVFKLHKIPDKTVSTENPRDELLRRHLLWQLQNLVVIEGGLRLDLLSPRRHLEFFWLAE